MKMIRKLIHQLYQKPDLHIVAILETDVELRQPHLLVEFSDGSSVLIRKDQWQVMASDIRAVSEDVFKAAS